MKDYFYPNETPEEKAYREELGKHEGKWVAVLNEYDIIASEDDLSDLFKRIEELDEDDAVVFKVNSLPSFYSLMCVDQKATVE